MLVCEANNIVSEIMVPSVGMRHVWNTWDIVWDTLGHNMGQFQNA